LTIALIYDIFFLVLMLLKWMTSSRKAGQQMLPQRAWQFCFWCPV